MSATATRDEPAAVALVLRGPVEQRRVEAALQALWQAREAYRLAARPKPFGMLQAALCQAKASGASCLEVAAVLQAPTPQEDTPDA